MDARNKILQWVKAISHFLEKWISVVYASNVHMDRYMRFWCVQVWVRTLSKKEDPTSFIIGL